MLDPDSLPYLPCLLALARERDWQHAAEACGVSTSELVDIVRATEVRHGHPLVKTGSPFEGFTPQGERVVALAKELQAGLEALEQCLHRQPTSLDSPASDQHWRHRHCLTSQRTRAGRIDEPAPWRRHGRVNSSDRRNGSSAT